MNEFSIGNMLPQVPISEKSNSGKKHKVVKNDKGETVPDVCPKCGSKVKVFFKGEPVFLCSNKKCNKYFGVVPVNECASITETTSDGLIGFAMDGVKYIHAHYEKDKKEPTGNQNCLLCTWCGEAFMRGIKAPPRPVYSPRDSIFNIKCEDIVVNPKKVNIKNKSDVLKIVGDNIGSRWYCHVNWSDSEGGHEFMLINSGGKIYVADFQEGYVLPINDRKVKYYFEEINYKNSFIVRLDTQTFNCELFKRMNDRNKTLLWDSKLDIPYMVKEGLLSKKEATKYYNGLHEEASITEACKDVKAARKFVSDVEKLAKKYDANYFIVTDGASGIHNDGNPAVKNARDSHIEWEKKNGHDPYEDWSGKQGSKTESTKGSYLNMKDSLANELAFMYFESDNDTDIPDLIEPIVKELESKGYQVKYASPGHINTRFNNDRNKDGVINSKMTSTARVIFSRDYRFKATPQGWEWRILHNNSKALYVKPYTFNEKMGNAEEAFKKWQTFYITNLKTWAAELPKVGSDAKTSPDTNF